MEVQCSNCATEYEFDDALVSARGTSVKCTNCGHQFRVHPVKAPGAVAETWIVRGAGGGETEFKSLRDLQQGIVHGTLTPTDQMSHGGQPFRALQDIYELQTFFSAARQRSDSQPPKRTLLGGLGVPTRPTNSPSAPPPRKRTPEHPRQERVTPVAGIPAMSSVPPAARTSSNSLPPPAGGRIPVESGARPTTRTESVPPPRRNAGARSSNPDQSNPGQSNPGPLNAGQSNPGQLNPGQLNPGQSSPGRSNYPTPLHSGSTGHADLPWQNMEGLRPESEVPEAPGSGAGSRWIVALVVVGALLLIGGTVGRDYFVRFVEPKKEEIKLDPRVPQLLSKAATLLGGGDLETARIELAKASVLADKEPSVVAAVAHLELARAELLALQLEVNKALAEAEQAAAPARKRWKSAAEKAAEAAEVERKGNFGAQKINLRALNRAQAWAFRLPKI
jgi:predicted Zn finger-like uncharacterized protein